MLPRQRDILPLPPQEVNPLHAHAPICRNVKRRIMVSNYKTSLVNQAISATNTLGGHDKTAFLDPRFVGANSLAAVDEIRRAVDSMGKPFDPSLSDDGALRQLLAKTSVYQDDRLDVKPYSRDSVSWPPPGNTACPLSKGLGEADRVWFAEWKKHMLSSIPDQPPFVESNHFTHDPKHIPTHVSAAKSVKAYCDPVLFSNLSLMSTLIFSVASMRAACSGGQKLMGNKDA